MNLRNIYVTHVVGDPRLVSELRPLLAGAGASRFSSVIVLCDITWTVRARVPRVGAEATLSARPSVWFRCQCRHQLPRLLSACQRYTYRN